MQKTAIQILITAALIFGLWFGLSRINWESLLHVKQASDKTEEMLGEATWTLIEKSETEIHSKAVTTALDTMINRICVANDIDRSKIKVHVFQKDEVNAFALPDNYLVVYSGLLNEAKNEEEVIGVLGHEIGHMQKKHVMKKLVKEIGLSALISITTGNKGGEVAKQAAKVLSSTAYDRTLESEADMTSVDYMLKADVDPAPFADFLYRLSDEEANVPKQLYWISTHPESKERAEVIVDKIKNKKITKKKVLSQEQWDKLKEKIKEEND